MAKRTLVITREIMQMLKHKVTIQLSIFHSNKIMKSAILLLLTTKWSHAEATFRFPVVGDWGGKDGTPYSTIAQRMWQNNAPTSKLFGIINTLLTLLGNALGTLF